MFPNDKAIFSNELEDYLRNVKKLAEASVKVYLSRVRKLLESGYSVSDLFGGADRLWKDYSVKGQSYDPKDHGNTRAAIKHVADLVREKILAEFGCPFVSYEKGWSSFRPKGKYESGYVIDNGVITFSYNIGFNKGKDVVKKISATNIKELNRLFERAYKKGCFASSCTCISTVHGNKNKFDYSFADIAGTNCCCLFEGDSAEVEQLNNEYNALIQKLRT